MLFFSRSHCLIMSNLVNTNKQSLAGAQHFYPLHSMPTTNILHSFCLWLGDQFHHLLSVSTQSSWLPEIKISIPGSTFKFSCILVYGEIEVLWRVKNPIPNLMSSSPRSTKKWTTIKAFIMLICRWMDGVITITKIHFHCPFLTSAGFHHDGHHVTKIMWWKWCHFS